MREQRATASIKMGLFGILLFLMAFIVKPGISLIHDSEYLYLLPGTIATVFGLVYGAEGIISSKWYFGILGIIISLIAFGLVIVSLGSACC